ncbi:MAG: family 43 glycosylhydrolase [Bacteroidota bacterium]|nr:family 43 glycosylhydrolase [Bacteroidota bacterium]
MKGIQAVQMYRIILSGLFILFSQPSVLAQVVKPDTTKAPPAVLKGAFADPHITVFDKTFYLYPTTDGTEGWLSTNFTCWSSRNLVDWQKEGVILDLLKDISWAKVRAWAPAIAQKNGKYYFIIPPIRK